MDVVAEGVHIPNFLSAEIPGDTDMTDYVYLFRGGDTSEMGFSPEEMQQHMQKWFAWIASLRDQGIYIGGEPLEDECLVVTPDRAITDGPFLESKEMIGGYVMISADSIDEAAELAKGCPVLLTHGKVEVRPVALIEGHNEGQT